MFNFDYWYLIYIYNIFQKNSYLLAKQNMDSAVRYFYSDMNIVNMKIQGVHEGLYTTNEIDTCIGVF